jgi:hypothetical protein
MILSMVPAFAGTITYTLSGSSADTITFSLSQTPTPSACAYGSGCFSVDTGTLSIDGGSAITGTVSFYAGGGLSILQGSTLLVNNGSSGQLLYSTVPVNPTLLTFSSLQLSEASTGGPRYDEAFVLNASTGVPEPSTAMLFLAAGSLLAGVRLRRRSR